MVKNILFVCKYNRFRSKYAESYFNKLNKNKNIKVKSAGIIRGGYPLDKNQVLVAKERRIKLRGKPKGINTNLLKWQDIILITADDVPSEIFRENKMYGKKLIVWKIPDVIKDSKEEIRGIMNKIENKVQNLIEVLNEK